MDLIETSFDKKHISQCAARCFLAYHRPHLSPDEAKCLQQCTRTILKNQNALLTLRYDNKLMPLCAAQV